MGLDGKCDMKYRITKLQVTAVHIPSSRSDNPIVSALYRGMKDAKGADYFYGDSQGKVEFDILNQCYWIWTGEYDRPPVKAGELLHAWLSAWYHGKQIFPIRINFTEDTAEIACGDKTAFLSFWRKEPPQTENSDNQL